MIIDYDKLPIIIDSLRGCPSTIVLTNGCFDMFHYGHLSSLKFAKSQGDFLFVGINSDKSVKELKGETRPIISETQRLEIVASLKCVDFALLFDSTSATGLIEAVKPDIYVKSTQIDDPEHRLVTELGGKNIYSPMFSVMSTTELIKRIQIK